MAYCITLTTTNSEENKQALIEQILNQQLAACIQTMPIESHYVWQGKVCNDKEWLLVIKTTQKNYQALEQVIVAHHSYEVPQVIQVPFVEGYNPYLSWLEATTRP
ncbi:divalent-cation tolerance protein CutA [Vibrio sp. LaRot3]|uniref:divalent-cation tolerance protein CutA n=1 Tax=Vibrio sp. LaRot3 TaxID=2998829 RepID=UPI0022CDCEAA|nr:divalent-cation tolerance protein CutA [Vibrio sp. LaRot3]MDA0148489.1 divalent-cation tolerance protein CutA [Vibrio sp. LaRot3]